MSARMGRPPTGRQKERPSASRSRIEQAIAYGRSVQWMTENLGCTVEKIEEARQHIEDVNDEDSAEGLEPVNGLTYSPLLAAERDVVGINAARARDARSLLEQIALTPAGERCGTWTAYCRHHRRWEPIDPLCRLAARVYSRERNRRQRAAARELRKAAA